MTQVVLASGNAGKLRELNLALNPLGFSLVSQTDLGLPSPDETGLSFVENALIKARAASRASGLSAIADDSGLCVDCLHGAPGIYSARFGDGTDSGNLQTLLQTLEQGAYPCPWHAHYHCTLVFVRTADDPDPLIAQGRWRGQIINSPQGEGGFGYDPIFYLPELHCTVAELDRETKNRFSHRGIAAQHLSSLLKDL